MSTPPIPPATAPLRIREVMAVRDYPDSPKKGASKPLFMRCDDDNDYLVKLPVPAWPMALPNELIGAGRALLANVLIPEPAIVRIPPELVAVSAGLQRRGVVAGRYFGSRRLANPIDLADAIAKHLHPTMVLNREGAAGIVAFDNWVRNMDRNDGNVLLDAATKSPGSPRFRMFAIDHGLILTGQAWNPAGLVATSGERHPVPCHPFVSSCIWDAGEFHRFKETIRTLSEQPIREAVQSVPIEWGLTLNAREAATTFLLARRGLIDDILAAISLAPDTTATAP